MPTYDVKTRVQTKPKPKAKPPQLALREYFIAI